ncbi:hypothetical protein GBZ26_01140 [Azospirillum formosense]|uniref:Uncharacterized protein n=1 Tax=Azospirillum formosense TaxID=861533 RepID=A0ABX2KQ52_9PROT|nr:hypothetical protein [Azospirillum formosense]MBY3752305.1 hypothetical protein [Azospirillum formosense]NUB17832.1 hypothetical protein [Azospirillum formosense]
MDVSSPLAGAPAVAAAKATSVSQGAGSGSSGAATAAAVTGAKDTLSLSPLAASLKGPSLDLFNKLKQNERTLLSGLVDSGKITGDDVNNALMGSLKMARSTAFMNGGRMFESQNRGLFARAATVTADEMLKATGDTLARRKELVAQLGELDKNGQGGSADYSEILRALSGVEPGAGTDQPSAEPHGNSRATAHLRQTRIISPYIMKLGDPFFIRSGEEEAARNKLKEAGVSLSSLTDAARGMGEDDVAGIVQEQASHLAEIMRRNGG